MYFFQVDKETTGRELVEHLINNNPEIAQDRARFVQHVSSLFDEYTTVRPKRHKIITTTAETLKTPEPCPASPGSPYERQADHA